jgi:glycosyltransferase involved in cell wall biosynthesis
MENFKDDTFIVIAAYNESKNIIKVVDSLRQAGYKNIVITDDGSTDDTYAVLQSIPGIHILHHIINRGQGAALQTGQAYALQNGAKYIVHFDADGQHPLEQIPDMVMPLVNGECEMTSGSRFITKESKNEVPASKKFILSLGTWFNWFLYGVKMTDAHNGFRAMTADAAGKIVITEDRFEHASEIIDLLSLKNIKYKEIPVVINYDNAEERTAATRGGAIFRPKSFRFLYSLTLEKLIKIYT